MNFLKKHPLYVIILLVWIYSIGVLGLSFDFSREMFKDTVPFTLLLSLLCLALFHENFTPRFILLAFIIYLLGLLIEIAGVSTGLVFGEYSYGRTLGVKIWGTPLMIGVNWLTLTYMVWIMLSRYNFPKVITALLGSALLVFYDFFLEPVAIWLDMWAWQDVRVPFQNYMAWFVISFVFLLLTGMMNLNFKNKIAPALFIIQLVFFIILNIVSRLFI